jgi:hypothetical protein
MVCEITVTIKNDEKKLTHKHLVYEDIRADTEDPIIKEFIDRALKEFDAPAETIRVKISLDN